MITDSPKFTIKGSLYECLVSIFTVRINLKLFLWAVCSVKRIPTQISAAYWCLCSIHTRHKVAFSTAAADDRRHCLESYIHVACATKLFNLLLISHRCQTSKLTGVQRLVEFYFSSLLTTPANAHQTRRPVWTVPSAGENVWWHFYLFGCSTRVWWTGRQNFNHDSIRQPCIQWATWHWNRHWSKIRFPLAHFTYMKDA